MDLLKNALHMTISYRTAGALGMLIAAGLAEWAILIAPLSLSETRIVRWTTGFLTVVSLVVLLVFAKKASHLTRVRQLILHATAIFYLVQLSAVSFLFSSSGGQRLFNSPLAIWDVSAETNNRLVSTSLITLTTVFLLGALLRSEPGPVQGDGSLGQA